MKTGLIICTALLPTIGHRHLIHWAYQFLQKVESNSSNQLFVVICTRDKEPTSFKFRADGLRHFSDVRIINIHDNAAPQNPTGPIDNEFWQYWKTAIQNACGRKKFDFVFSSEVYGNKLAEALNSIHIPVDPNREIYKARGTDVRKNILENFHLITPPIQKELQKTIVFFGAESVGKTTAAKWAAENMNGHFVHEWARPYLETVGPDLNFEKMAIIEAGQKTAEYMVRHDVAEYKPFIFQDTDLLSTVGYHRIMYGVAPDNLEKYCVSYYRNTKNRLYIVLDTDIPFEEDQLRYGGKVRESDTQFWIDLLNEFGQRYVVFKRSDAFTDIFLLKNLIIDEFNDPFVEAIQNFKRE